MTEINTAIALAAGVVLLLGLFSRAIKGGPLSVPLIAFSVGILAGPQAAGWLTPEAWPHETTILKEAARFTLAISTMGIALRTPWEDVLRLVRPVGLLLLIGMFVMWAVSAGLGWAVLGLSPLAALLMGALVTPTDPVVASSIVTGQPAESLLPDRLRSTLSLESASNDGLGYMIVLLPILVLTQGLGGQTWAHWVVDVIGVGILAAIAYGFALGAVVGGLMRLVARVHLMEPHSMLSLSIALSLLAVSSAHLFGGDGILASFSAGLGLNMASRQEETYAEQNVQEAVSKLFNLPVFVILGTALPWAGWQEMGTAGLAFALLVIFLRRPAALIVAGPTLGPRLALRDMVFLGWFGPVGVAAIFYSLLALERTGDPVYWHGASLVVALSIVLHGLTALPGIWLFRRRDRAAPPVPR